MKQIAPDKGSGPYDSEEPGFQEGATPAKTRGITESADAMDLVDAARHMDHCLDDDGKPLNLPVDKMMADDDGFRKHIDGQMARLHTTVLPQKFDMSESSSVKHYDLGSATPNTDPLPESDAPGREGGRTDNGRETRQGRAGTGR